MSQILTKAKVSEIIGYDFRDQNLMILAFTHSSYANKNQLKSNQRLEFLGDSVLSLVVSDYIYKKFENYNEGELTRFRAAVVCEKKLAKVATSLNLGSIILMGRSETLSHGRQKESILADTFESLVGAIYLDSGLDSVKFWIDKVLKIENENASLDYKSKIQMYFQRKYKNVDMLKYSVIKQVGPSHAPSFKVELAKDGQVIGMGRGLTRREAEQIAAKDALEQLELLTN